MTFERKTHHYNIRKPLMIIIHGTEVDDTTSRAIFDGTSKREASTHYYIDDAGKRYQYLEETDRAWHSGAGYWAGHTDINSLSIGVELMSISKNGRFDGKETFYTDAQMVGVIKLLQEITERNPQIYPWHILGHQDVSCTREHEPEPIIIQSEVLKKPVSALKKYDPGPSFDWKKLAENGIGLWHDLEEIKDDPVVIHPERIQNFNRNMAAYGYDMRKNRPGNENHTSAIRAFQSHFLPWNITGEVTEQSVQALDILLEKKLSL